MTSLLWNIVQLLVAAVASYVLEYILNFGELQIIFNAISIQREICGLADSIAIFLNEYLTNVTSSQTMGNVR